MPRSPGKRDQDVDRSHELVLQLDGFSWDALTEEASRLEVSVQELATFAVLYYIADLDSGRIARRFPAAAQPLT